MKGVTFSAEAVSAGDDHGEDHHVLADHAAELGAERVPPRVVGRKIGGNVLRERNRRKRVLLLLCLFFLPFMAGSEIVEHLLHQIAILHSLLDIGHDGFELEARYGGDSGMGMSGGSRRKEGAGTKGNAVRGPVRVRSGGVY